MYNEKTLDIPDYMVLLRALKICKDTDISMVQYCDMIKLTPSYISHLKKEFLSKGWITVKKENKNKYMKLTESGMLVAAAIEALLDVMEINDENLKEYRVSQKAKLKEVKHEDPGKIC